MSIDELKNFDQHTRDEFEATIIAIKRVSLQRVIFAIILGAIAFTCGKLLEKTKGGSPTAEDIMALLGGAAIAASALFMAQSLWLASRPGQYVAALKRHERDEQARKDALTRLST
jgi:hypothetical protein